MSFVDGFYSVNLEVANPTEGQYASVRLRAAKHPLESFEQLQARILALCHSYHPQLGFSEGLFQPTQPTLWRKDVTEEVLDWIEVGVPERKKLERALKQFRPARFRIYFHLPEQRAVFAHLLRGSKTNWIAPIEFLQLDPELISALAERIETNVNLSVTVVDDSMYLTYQGEQFETQIPHLNMWDEFQESLRIADGSGR